MVTQPKINLNVSYDFETSNTSFLEIHYFLKQKGIKNNYFFLALIDTGLKGINPRDPRLNQQMKIRIMRECLFNYWYFIREVVAIPSEGANTSGTPYILSRANLALNYGFVRNWNMFLEIPRQNGKTVSAVIRYLWVFLFGTRNSSFMFANKKLQDSKDNLERFKSIRKTLPIYLRFDSAVDNETGKTVKGKNNVTFLEHPTNGNKVNTLGQARSLSAANGLGRGCTQPIQWYDEYAFIPYNKTIYLSATPAFSQASDNAKRQGAPYGILITTTPGDLSEQMGLDAFKTRNLATEFFEDFYDYSEEYLQETLSQNTNSSFVHIRFTYSQLGRGEEWFSEQCTRMEKDWPAIRREILLEWATVATNSPFNPDDLDKVKQFIREPIRTITLAKYYKMHIYSMLNPKYPPIIGVDVSGGYKNDSSAITVIDSLTTNVVAILNCNYISPTDLAVVVYELVTKHMPTAIVNIERNGGYGASIIGKLKKTSIKKNLYFEYKDRVVEEQVDTISGRRNKRKVLSKEYGLNSTEKIRSNLIEEILRDRMEFHKDKFVAEIIYNELEGLQIKRNGKIEHSSNSHDDQVFSYLMALYVWYEGQNLASNFGIIKKSIRSDSDIDEYIEDIEADRRTDITTDILSDNLEEVAPLSKAFLEGDNSMLFSEFKESLRQQDAEVMNIMMSIPAFKKAYNEKYHVKDDEDAQLGITHLPDSLFSMTNK